VVANEVLEINDLLEGCMCSELEHDRRLGMLPWLLSRLGRTGPYLFFGDIGDKTDPSLSSSLCPFDELVSVALEGFLVWAL
jgi:hypothetical protein